MSNQDHGTDPFGTSGGPNVLQIAWRRKSLLILGLVFGVAIGGLVYLQSRPVYRSAAQVLIVKKSPDVLPIPGSDPRSAVMVDYVSTHLTLIGSPEVVRRSLNHLDRETTSSLPVGENAAVSAIISGLEVERVERDGEDGPSNVILLSFKGPEPLDCQRVLFAVVQGYQDFLAETYANVSEDAAELIEEARTRLDTDLKAKEKEYREFRRDKPSAFISKDGVSPERERVNSIGTRLTELQLRQAEIEQTLLFIKQELDEKKPAGEILRALSEDPDTREPGPNRYEDQLAVLTMREAELSENFGEDYSELRAVRRQIESARSRLPDADSRLKPEDRLVAMTAGLRAERTKNAGLLEQLGGILAAEEAEARKAAERELEHEEFRRTIASMQQLFDQTVKRVTELDLMSNSGGYDAKIISPPGPGGKVAPNMPQTLMFGGVLGLMVGFGLGYLAEHTDKRFRTPEEIRRHLGLSVVGHLLPLDPDETVTVGDPPLEPALVAHYRPRSPQAESLRGIRTALYFGTEGKEHRVIQVTSPNPGDGKSTAAANLAVSFAQSGRRTLLMDADFRKPRVHKLFGIEPAVGLATVAAGGADLDDAVVESGVENLWLCPCGPRPKNPAELLTSPQFLEALTELRERFEVVLIDTPPVLAVSDPSIVAQRVDGLLVVLRVGSGTRPAAVRTREILAGLGVNILGVLVNAVDARPGGKGEYGYGYNYDYGYEYGSAYGEAEADPDAEVALPPKG